MKDAVQEDNESVPTNGLTIFTARLRRSRKRYTSATSLTSEILGCSPLYINGLVLQLSFYIC